jgi:outer membrane protein
MPIAAMAAALLLQAAAPETLTLESALQRALTSNLPLRRAEEEIAAAEAQKRASLSLVLPKLSVTGALTRNSEQVSFGSGDDSRTILPLNDWATRITVNQPVFAGLREKRAYDQAKVGIENARDLVAGARDQALLAVSTHYLATVQGEALMAVEQKNRELAEARRVHAQNLFDAGETTGVDVLRAEAAVKAAERRAIAARQERDAASGRLRVALALDSDVSVVEPAGPLAPPATEAELTALAAEQRSEVQQARNNVRIAQLEVQKQKGAYLPVVTADAGWVYQKTTFPKDEYGYAALRFTVPVFQGGEVGARVAAARVRLRQAELSLEEAQRQVREEVRVSLQHVEAERTSLQLAEEQRQAAQAEYDQALEMYRAQEATALDMEAAEALLADASRAVATSRLDLRLAELRAWAAAGALTGAVMKETGK